MTQKNGGVKRPGGHSISPFFRRLSPSGRSGYRAKLLGTGVVAHVKFHCIIIQGGRNYAEDIWNSVAVTAMSVG